MYTLLYIRIITISPLNINTMIIILGQKENTFLLRYRYIFLIKTKTEV